MEKKMPVEVLHSGNDRPQGQQQQPADGNYNNGEEDEDDGLSYIQDVPAIVSVDLMALDAAMNAEIPKKPAVIVADQTKQTKSIPPQDDGESGVPPERKDSAGGNVRRPSRIKSLFICVIGFALIALAGFGVLITLLLTSRHGSSSNSAKSANQSNESVQHSPSIRQTFPPTEQPTSSVPRVSPISETTDPTISYSGSLTVHFPTDLNTTSESAAPTSVWIQSESPSVTPPPSDVPSSIPSSSPTTNPTTMITSEPTTTSPTSPPTALPTSAPTTSEPTNVPTTLSPTMHPSSSPTTRPTTELDSVLPEYTLVTMMQDPSSPQAKAYEWLHNHPNLNSMPVWRKQQLFALASIFMTLENGSNWLSYTSNECNWLPHSNQNNICTRNLQYLQLSFTGVGMATNRSTIPPEVSLLPLLTTFVFTDATLGGLSLSNLLPTELEENLSNLNTVAFHQCSVSGTIPSSVGRFQTLENLIVSNNFLSGTVPTELGTVSTLRALNLSQNRLSGTLPTVLGTLNHLVYFNAAGNAFTGTIPWQWGAGWTNVKYLQFTNNVDLSGPVPSEIGLMNSLQELDLGGTSLTGTVPEEVCSLRFLKKLLIPCNTLSCPSQKGCSCQCAN